MIFLLATQALIAQEESTTKRKTHHSIAVGMGYMAYKNSYSLPNGLPGKSMCLLYQLQKSPADKKHNFLFHSNLVYAELTDYKNLDINKPLFNYLRGNIGGGFTWPLFSTDKKLQLFGGGNLTIDGEYLFHTETGKQIVHAPQTFGKLALLINSNLIAQLKLKNITIINSTNFALITAGRFPVFEYVNTSVRNTFDWELFSPNTITHLGKYRLLENRLQINTFIYNHNISFLYLISLNHYDINNNVQKYAQHTIGIGLNF
jgi:hypothetical protein